MLYHRHQCYTHTIFLLPFDMPLTGRLAKENSARWSADGAEERRSEVYRYCCPKRNRVCTTEERFELINHIWSEAPFTSIATSAGISPGRLYTWVHKYKETGYIGLIDCRKTWNQRSPIWINTSIITQESTRNQSMRNLSVWERRINYSKQRMRQKNSLREEK